jgi:hypothetical protein
VWQREMSHAPQARDEGESDRLARHGGRGKPMRRPWEFALARDASAHLICFNGP